MKLHEIKNTSGSSWETISVETANYGKLKLRIEYDWESSSSDRHGDNASFDEYHEGGNDISKITLAEPIKDYDEDGEPTISVDKGTDVKKLASWDKWDDKEVEKALDKYLKIEDDPY